MTASQQPSCYCFLMTQKFVFHGTPKKFDSDVATPRRNIRERDGVVIFDEESFHATPHKWIALAYTYHPKPIESLGIGVQYLMGVNLYSEEKEVVIFGVGTLEESLAALYGDGGYVYHFTDGDFIYKEGLGDMEVISQVPTNPIVMEKVDNPVEEMRKLGAHFVFIDLALPQNEKFR